MTSLLSYGNCPLRLGKMRAPQIHLVFRAAVNSIFGISVNKGGLQWAGCEVFGGYDGAVQSDGVRRAR